MSSHAQTQSDTVLKGVIAFHTLLHSLDNRYIVREGLAELLGKTVELEAFVDSRTLFNIIAMNSNTAERILQIDVFSLKKRCRRE